METKGSSTTRIAPGGGGSLRVLGELVTCKVTAGQTEGAYSLFEVVSPPGGVPQPHVQHLEDECLYVIEGVFEFIGEGETFLVDPGSVIYVPKGTLHAYRNAGKAAGRLLITQTPGGVHERFFEEVGVSAAEGAATKDALDPAGLAAVAATYGIEMAAFPGTDGRVS